MLLKNILKTTVLFILVIILSACNTTDKTKIALLHTNDMHGQLINFDRLSFVKDSLLKIYDTVFVLSAGDMFSGNPYVDFHTEQGFPIVDIMNKIEYSAAALGNHEFDYGQTILKDRISQADFPILANNLTAKDSIINTINRFHSLWHEDIEIKLISLIETSNSGKPATHPKNLDDIAFDDFSQTIKNISSSYSTNDIVVGLTHLGYDDDSLLALETEIFDVIIGGHSHTLIEEENLINDVLVVQAGDYMKYAGLVELEFEDKQLINRHYKLLNLSNELEVDSAITNSINQHQQSPFLDEELATIELTLKNRQEMGCLYTDAQRYVLQSDFAFQNYWGMRVDSIEAGPITRKDVLAFDPFQNEMILFNLSGQEIRELITTGYNLYSKFDLLISGGSYIVHTDSADSLLKVELFDEDLTPVDNNKTYKVAINSYVASTYKFSSLEKGKNTGTITSDNIIEYLKSLKTVNYQNCKRVQVLQSSDE